MEVYNVGSWDFQTGEIQKMNPLKNSGYYLKEYHFLAQWIVASNLIDCYFWADKIAKMKMLGD
jgi:hypothetical protein